MEKQHCFGKLLMGNYVIFFQEQIHFSLLGIVFLLMKLNWEGTLAHTTEHVMHVGIPWFLRSSGGFYRGYFK